jgi:hypothetical protein
MVKICNPTKVMGNSTKTQSLAAAFASLTFLNSNLYKSYLPSFGVKPTTLIFPLLSALTNTPSPDPTPTPVTAPIFIKWPTKTNNPDLFRQSTICFLTLTV